MRLRKFFARCNLGVQVALGALPTAPALRGAGRPFVGRAVAVIVRLRTTNGCAGGLFREPVRRTSGSQQRARPGRSLGVRDLGCRNAVRGRMTRGHVPGCRKARFGRGHPAIGHAPGTSWCQTAALRQTAQVGRAAGDRVDVAVAPLAAHGRGENTCRIGVSRRVQNLGDRPALDRALGRQQTHQCTQRDALIRA